MPCEHEPSERDSIARILANSSHACVLLAGTEVHDRTAHKLAVDVYRELDASIVYRETGFEVQFNRKCGSVDRSNECARSLVGTGVNLGLLKLLEGVSVDCDRHRRRGEAGGAHCGGQFAGIERGVMWLR